ncbi:MAG: putative ABC transport system permease protein [Paraglaciecola sp.]
MGFEGFLAAYLFFDGLSTSTLRGTFTKVVFTFELSGNLFMQGALMGLVICFVSRIFPAGQAARVPVAVAFQAGR